ncbi:hypothetical protein GGQ76_004265 [Aureimonas jatrophae]|uniref:Uncharacterized protein n=1 Tax=Aureimonas jatrophae TaxID=1166073 RepID=A0A1H0MID4_9HYPH|nr:hypothetical protein [Aureimonas jatrophae]SDO80199.1 hypothetical protein SAMN05192530_11414 [Aureimonas jatrophae]
MPRDAQSSVGFRGSQNAFRDRRYRHVNRGSVAPEDAALV